MSQESEDTQTGLPVAGADLLIIRRSNARVAWESYRDAWRVLKKYGGEQYKGEVAKYRALMREAARRRGMINAEGSSAPTTEGSGA